MTQSSELPVPPPAGAAPAPSGMAEPTQNHSSPAGIASMTTPPPSPTLPERSQRRARLFRRATVVLMAALIVLGLAWELVLAPLRPQGSLLALKVLPLVFALPALRRGWVRAYQLWVMLILLYLCEGIVRGMSDTGLSARLAWLETALATAGYASMMLYVRALRPPVRPRTPSPASGQVPPPVAPAGTDTPPPPAPPA